MKENMVWLLNLFLKILRLLKRDKNIWIFGAWGGNAYKDNSKYLFEYVCKHYPEIRAVWITKNIKIKESLTQSGKECYLFDEKIGIKLRLKVGFVFYSNGMNDLGVFDLCHGATKVALWHGMPLKRMCYATNNLRKRKVNILRYLQYLKLKLYNYAQRDITIATSEVSKKFLIECYEVENQNVLITGQPRNDALFDTSSINEFKRKLGHEENERFVLYMPTWRDEDQKNEFLDPLVNQLINDTKFIQSLIDEGVKLYIKPHPKVTLSLDHTEISNIIVLDHSYIIDSQLLLGSSDVLITDYSSAFIDYALLERPTHFYVPDLKKYNTGRNGTFLAFEEFVDYWFTDLNTFKSIVNDSINFQKAGIENSYKINKVYNDDTLVRGEYCNKLISTLKTWME